MISLTLVYFAVFLSWSCFGLEVTPERAGVVYENPKYIKDIIINVRRYSRRSPYVLNAKATTLHTWQNNITLHLIFYEYLHNEYKRSFVEMKFKLCDLMNKDPLLSPVVKMIGLPCPLPAGVQNLPNMTLLSVPAVNQLPYKWPFERAKISIMFQTFPEKVKISELYAIASFKQSLVIKKKKS